MNINLTVVPNFKLSFIDYPDRSQWCTTIYTIGCPHSCKGCHKYVLKNINYQDKITYDIETFICMMKHYANENNTNNFCLMGGEPLAPWNIDAIRELLIVSNEANYNICLYTGYDVDYVKSNNITGFYFLKTGGYNCDLHINNTSSDVFMLGSENQQLWDYNFNLLSNRGVYNIN